MGKGQGLVDRSAEESTCCPRPEFAPLGHADPAAARRPSFRAGTQAVQLARNSCKRPPFAPHGTRRQLFINHGLIHPYWWFSRTAMKDPTVRMTIRQLDMVVTDGMVEHCPIS